MSYITISTEAKETFSLVSNHFMRIGAGWNKMRRICQKS